LDAMRAFHGDQVVRCKTVGGCILWSAEMAGGCFAERVIKAWAFLEDLALLRKCGWHLSTRDCSRHGWFSDSLQVLAEEEEDWCLWVVRVLCSLTRNRLRHLFYYTLGPGMLAGLLHPDAAVVTSTLTRLRSIRLGYKASCNLTHPAAVSASKNAWVTRHMLAKVLRMLDTAGWKEVHTEVNAVLRSIFSMVSTKLIEDAFQRLRATDQRGQCSRVVANDRMWHVLVAQRGGPWDTNVPWKSSRRGRQPLGTSRTAGSLPCHCTKSSPHLRRHTSTVSMTLRMHMMMLVIKMRAITTIWMIMTIMIVMVMKMTQSHQQKHLQHTMID